MLRSIRKNWLPLLSSAAFLTITIVILNRGEGLGSILAAWQRLDSFALAVAILLMLGVNVVSAWRSKLILQADEVPNAAFMPLFRIQLVALFVAHGMPISALADVARAGMLKLRFNISTTRSLRLILFDRICGALGAVVVGLVTACIQIVIGAPAALTQFQLVVWSVGLAGIGFLVLYERYHFVTGFEMLDRIARAVLGLARMISTPSVGLPLLALSLLQLLIIALVFAVLGRGMNLNVPEIYVFLYTPIIFFVSSLPIFYQGWGGREAAVVATLGSLGTMTASECIALSVAFGAITFIASLPGAVFWLLRPSMRKNSHAEGDPRMHR